MKKVNVCYFAPKVKQSGEWEIAILFILIQREKQYNKHSAWQAHNDSRKERERRNLPAMVIPRRSFRTRLGVQPSSRVITITDSWTTCQASNGHLGKGNTVKPFTTVLHFNPYIPYQGQTHVLDWLAMLGKLVKDITFQLYKSKIELARQKVKHPVLIKFP